MNTAFTTPGAIHELLVLEDVAVHHSAVRVRVVTLKRHGIDEHEIGLSPRLEASSVDAEELGGLARETPYGPCHEFQNNISHSPINYFIEPCCGTNAWTNDTNIVVKNNLVYNASVAGFTDPEYTFSGNITGQDPKFKSVTSRDFHLQAGSPAIDKGAYVAGYDYDADGNPIVGLPDIGAYEYSDGTPPPPPPPDTTSPSVPTGLTATLYHRHRSILRGQLQWTT